MAIVEMTKRQVIEVLRKEKLTHCTFGEAAPFRSEDETLARLRSCSFCAVGQVVRAVMRSSATVADVAPVAANACWSDRDAGARTELGLLERAFENLPGYDEDEERGQVGARELAGSHPHQSRGGQAPPRDEGRRMTTLRIGSPCEFKASPGLGGWRPGTVTGFVGKLIEVEAGGALYPVPLSRVRPAKEETRPDRGAQQAAARAQRLEGMDALEDFARVLAAAPSKRLVMAPPPMETEEVEEVIPRDVLPSPAWEERGFIAEPRASIRPQPKAPKPTRSEAYKKWVRMQDCAVTGAMAEDAHHYGPHALSEKGSDFTCVGLTHAEHSEWHTTGMSRHAEEWARAKGYGYGTLATKVMHLEGALRSLVSWLEKEGE